MTVSDPLPARADAIYVFPGEIPSRPLCAAELWRRGVAPRIVFSGGSLDRSLAAVGQPMTYAAPSYAAPSYDVHDVVSSIDSC